MDARGVGLFLDVVALAEDEVEGSGGKEVVDHFGGEVVGFVREDGEGFSRGGEFGEECLDAGVDVGAVFPGQGILLEEGFVDGIDDVCGLIGGGTFAEGVGAVADECADCRDGVGG